MTRPAHLDCLDHPARPANSIYSARPALRLGKFAWLLGLFALLVLPAACSPAPQPRLTVFAMQGPPLALVGGPLSRAAEQNAAAPGLSGSLERGGMVGNGEISLVYAPEALRCRGKLKDGPSANGRVRGLLACYPDSPGRADQADQAERAGQAKQPNQLSEPEQSGQPTQANQAQSPSLSEKPGASPQCFLMLTLEPHGPDQGVGLARFAAIPAAAATAATNATSLAGDDLEIAPGPPLLFFYHPWHEEAGRRFVEVRRSILQGMAAKKP